MEKFFKLLDWLKSLPLWARSLACLLIALALMLFTLSSCGTPKTMATVTNVNPNSTVTVTLSVQNSNTTTNNVDPTVTVDPVN